MKLLYIILGIIIALTVKEAIAVTMSASVQENPCNKAVAEAKIICGLNN